LHTGRTPAGPIIGGVYKTTARVTGALFLTATVAGVLSVALSGPASALLILVMAGAIAMIPPTLFPVLRRHGEGAALAYVAARLLEVVMLLPAAVGPLMAKAAPSPVVDELVRTEERWGQPASAMFFLLGAGLLYTLLFRSHLVPRWLSGWALVSILPYLAGALLAPLALNELVLAVWLLAKGFAVRVDQGV
jgi:hypothetical protein